MGDGIEKIHEKIRSFQKRYYLNILIKGSILTLAIVFFYFVLAAVLEHSLWLDSWSRFMIFIVFFITIGYCVFRFLKEPLQWWIMSKGIGEEQSAKIIGEKMPGIKDRLVNLLQLSSYQKSALAYASVKQKSAELEPLPFESIVRLNENKRFLKYLAIPVSIILVILLFNDHIITESTNRIIHFNQKFSPQPPFNFVIQNNALDGFYNEDFTLQVKLSGQALPENVYLQLGSQRFKMEHNDTEFAYTFENLQNPFEFQLEAAGFYSNVYHVELINRPELTGFEIELKYPAYIFKKNDILRNAGSLEIPEGTNVNWNLSTTNAQSARIYFATDSSSFNFQSSDNQGFKFSKSFLKPDRYEIVLENDKSQNRDRISYQINIVKDQYPHISVNNFKDSVLYQRVVLGGLIGDDYGLTQLSLHYRISDENRKEISSKSINIPILKNQLQQSFIYNWSLDSLKLSPGNHLEYYLNVWDNDGINGRKSTKSATYAFLIPTKNKLLSEIKQSSNETLDKIDESATKATDLQNKIEQASQRLKGKQNLDWQDKKMLEDIIQQKENLDQLIDQMKQQNKALQEKKEAFTEQDERIREKAEQIQKLMDKILDEETKKLFEELQKLLKENTDVSQLQKLLDKLNQNTNNVEKELDRMLEMFKEIEYESKFDQTAKELQEQVKKQQELLEKTEASEDKNSDNKKDNNRDNRKDDKSGAEKLAENDKNKELAKEQQDLKEQFEKLDEKMQELQELGKEIEQPAELPDEGDRQDIMDQQQKSQESLEENQPSKSKQSQKNALQKMQSMQQQMEASQNAMMMEIDMQNLEALRQIIHGLIKLSFDQENLMKTFNDLESNDPRFNKLAEGQLELKDNAKVLEDSLIALSKRDPFMGAFVTKEVGELNDHLDKVTEANQERRKPQAQNEMQLSMTSINNLALMLDSHFDMMMQMMANAKPSMRKSNQKGNKPSLSQLQQQLNNKIQQLKNSGKSGRELSEELAEMAAEQERIRRAIQEMEEKMKNKGQMPGGDLPSKMEQTELDLVNKNLTDQLIKRQQEILTRLLEAEKSMREQDMDDERKGETARDYEKEMPKAFEDYLRLKEKEVELLKTVPPKLYPYYKKEVDEYFKRIGNP